MPNISEISLYDTIYKLKDDSAVTQEQLEEALGNIDMSEVETHIADKNNPHGVTAEQINALPLSGGQMNIDSSIGWESDDFFMEVGNPDTDSQKLAFSAMKMNDGIMHVTGVNPNIIMTGRAGYEYQDLITITNEGISSDRNGDNGEIGLSRVLDNTGAGEKLKLGEFELVHISTTDPNGADIIGASVEGAIVKNIHDPIEAQDAATKSYVDALTKVYAQPNEPTNPKEGDIWIAIEPLIAYAVYSADDSSLTFYKTRNTIIEGSSYNGKEATTVYTGFETDTYTTAAVPWYSYRSSITTVTVADEGIAPVSTAKWFYDLTECTSMDLAKLDTSNVTDMSEMFDDCKELTELDLSNFNTQNVTVMRRMFRDCNSLKSIIFPENFGAAATDMEQMFNNCKALTELDLSNFSTQNVENMEWMFAWCQALTSLDFPSSFNTQNVIYMEKMFYECRALKSITFGSGWNTSNVMIMSSMFDCCTALPSIDLSNWNTQNVTNMRCMFMYCEELISVGDISGWNTQNVTDMNSMFAACSKLTANCRNWNVNKVTDHEDFKTFANGVIAPTWAA
jgi:surface protein